MDPRIKNIKLAIVDKNNSHLYGQKFTRGKIRTDVIEFLKKFSLFNSTELECSTHPKAKAILKYLNFQKGSLSFKNEKEFKQLIKSALFLSIENIMKPGDSPKTTNDEFLDFIERFYNISSNTNQNPIISDSQPRSICSNGHEEKDHTTPINTNDFQNRIINHYKSDGLPTMTIDLKFKIQESLFNYYEQTKSENISTGICRTNSTISNKVSNEILNFKQLTFITGSHNTNISQLATWLCQRACLQSDHKYPIPVYIDISGKTFSDNRYCLEEQVIAQYWKIKKMFP